jgi:hypothetical protein
MLPWLQRIIVHFLFELEVLALMSGYLGSQVGEWDLYGPFPKIRQWGRTSALRIRGTCVP